MTSNTDEVAASPAAAAVELDNRVTQIRPPDRLPRLHVGELWSYRELLGIFVWRDLVVRYKQTVVGVLWAIFQPLLMAFVYTVIFGRFADFPSGGVYYPVFVFGGLLPMLYFTSSLAGGMNCLVGNSNLVTKVYFPRVLLPFAAVLTPIVDLLLGLVVLAVLMVVYSTYPPSWATILVAPAFIAMALVTVLGLVLLLSAVNVRYRDVPYAIPVFLQVLPLLSGVPFALDGIPIKWQWILAFNPMTTVIAGWRWAIFGSPPPVLGQAAIGVAMAFLLFVLGLTYFRSAEPRFADQI